MSRLNQLAADLYPRWWRERYGAEFSALLDDARPSFRSTLDILKGALIMQLTTITPLRIFTVCALIGLGTAFAAYAVPEIVTSRAVLVVPGLETPDKEAELDQLAARASFNMLSRSGLIDIVRTQGVMFRGEFRKEPQGTVLDRLQHNIRISTVAVGAGRAMAIEVDRPYRPIRFSSGPILPVWFDPTTWGLDPSEGRDAGNREAQMLAMTIVSKILDQSHDVSRETGAKSWELLDPASLPESGTADRRFAAIFLGMPASVLMGGLLAWWYRRKSSNTLPPPTPLPA